MKVHQRMTPNPVTVTPETSHREAVELLKKHRIRRLPVLDARGKLVGIVTEKDLLSAGPSVATSLSIYEIYTLLDRLTIKQIMSSPVYAVDKDCGLSAAARFMIEKQVSALPVMDGEKVIGIITETDIFKTFVETLGGGLPGLRIDLLVPHRPGILAEIARAIADAGGNIVGMTSFKSPDESRAELSIKEQGANKAAVEASLEGIEGVTVLEVKPANVDQLLVFGR